ncbi:hypothetical protein DSTSK_06270 [Desulforhabdus sp. TSK]|nr:hypothetical protein DSTSK_06270 [Desulforhabdus sp. TSK]
MSSDASRADLKKAYRDLVKQWHPDRFQQASVWERRVAEEKFKEITVAYQRAMSAWKEGTVQDNSRRGEAPGTNPPVDGSRNGVATRQERGRSREWADRIIFLLSFLRKFPLLVAGWKQRSASLHLFAGGALVALFIFINLYWWLEATRSVSPPSTGSEVISVNRPPFDRFESAVTESSQQGERESPSQPSAESSLATEAPGAVASHSYFTLGSTPEDVKRVQGPPSKVKGSTWSYGLSEVQFRDNRVVRYNNFDGTLKVRLLPSSGSSGEGPLPLLTIGATKDDVLRLLGTPSRISGNRWYYGFSEVRFKEGRLIGYDNFFDHFAVPAAPFKPAKPADSSVPKDYFTIGSTQDDVVAAQGAPTSIQGNLWFYRSSTVLFRDGKVQWVSDTDGMLRFVAPEDVAADR